jgi:hypothetical protein
MAAIFIRYEMEFLADPVGSVHGSRERCTSHCFEAETRAWHADRVSRLTSEEGWLTLVGLHWLREGPQRFGSAPDNELVFPAGFPAHAGTFTRKGASVSLALEPGVSLTVEGRPFTGGALRTDADGKPDTLA